MALRICSRRPCSLIALRLRAGAVHRCEGQARTDAAGQIHPRHGDAANRFDAAERLATPLIIATRLGTVSFLSTVTVFGTPNDVTLSELALEMLFPADEATLGIVQRMRREQSEAEVADAAAS